MDAPAVSQTTRINRWLPYVAVLQTDLRQTLRSWVYRTWVLFSLLALVGYVLYRIGVHREAGIIQHASHMVTDLLRWAVAGSVAFVVVLTAGSISAERGTLADSVLSRGISRYQYFMGKWHARLIAILATYFVFGAIAVIAAFLFLHEDLSLLGSIVALLTVATLLITVVTFGVTVSALVNSTVLGIVVLWIVLYGGGFALSLVPSTYTTPDKALANLPHVLRGQYDTQTLGELVGGSVITSVVVALVGLGYFSRRDV